MLFRSLISIPASCNLASSSTCFIPCASRASVTRLPMMLRSPSSSFLGFILLTTLMASLYAVGVLIYLVIPNIEVQYEKLLLYWPQGNFRGNLFSAYRGCRASHCSLWCYGIEADKKRTDLEQKELKKRSDAASHLKRYITFKTNSIDTITDRIHFVIDHYKERDARKG